ncbi:NAD(P)/FAD-dependent oxidoreductase [Planctomicrobium sp. SH664]|uniref:NAD(P)/FAD-dependent oxidoreductase n=1 Tax=Planctomicrobium sp. SH664 TaxID=3448125 RepID=UPI003F5C7C52
MQEQPESPRRHQVVVVGGGFGGLHVVRGLRHSPVDVTLIDRRNFHLFQPLLYQVATGGLSPANIAAPLRQIFSRQKNCEVLLGNVTDIDLKNRHLVMASGKVPYDTLVVAAGSKHSYFGKENWEPLAPGLKTIEDATEIRARIFTAFEAAELEHDPELRKKWLRFVVVGGGPTGVELAGALAEIARHSLKHDFRSMNPAEAEVLLVEAGPRVLGAFPEELSRSAEQSLTRLGVSVWVNCRVTEITADQVEVHCQGDKVIPTKTVLWAAGVQASSLGANLVNGSQATLDRAGRVVVEPDLSLAGAPNVFVIGDLANYSHQDGKMLPGVAQVAIQEGEFVARLIDARVQGAAEPKFHYRDLGSLATIGKSSAVADFGKFKMSGWFAWMIWLFVHLMHIVSFRNRVLVLLQWGWNYVTYDRSARLITGNERHGLGAVASPETEALKAISGSGR